MDLSLNDHLGTRNLCLSQDEVDRHHRESGISSESDARSAIRRDTNWLVFERVPVFFTASMQVCLELLLRKSVFRDEEKNKVTALIDAYESFSKNVTHLPPDLMCACEVLMLTSHLFSTATTLKETMKYMKLKIYPKCNIRTMCFIHQLLSRVLKLQNGDVDYETSQTFIDGVCAQLVSHYVFYSEFSETFPCGVLNFAIKDIEKQMSIYRAHLLDRPGSVISKECPQEAY